MAPARQQEHSVIHSQVAKILSPVTIHFLTIYFIEYLSKYLFYVRGCVQYYSTSSIYYDNPKERLFSEE